jgi:hypothetical protein
MPFVRAALAVLVLAPFAAADTLKTLDNNSITGTIVSVSDKEVAIKKADGIVVSTPLENVIALELRSVTGLPVSTAYCDIRLVDDTVLLCESYQIKGKTVEAKLLGGQLVRIPLGSVLSILRDAHDATLKKQWDALAAQNVKRDRVVIYKDGEVNSIEGTIAEADADGAKILFRPVGSEQLNVAMGKIHGMLFYREAPANAPAAVCLVYDVAGNVLAAVKVEAEGSKIVVHTTIPQVTIECDAAKIARFDYNMGKLVFLSDMAPARVVEKSAAGLVVTHRRDANLDGDAIVLGRPYAKGLSLHAYTELEFDLKGRFKRFSADLGVDPRVGAESQAKVVIEIDGKVLYSGIATVREVVPVHLDVTKGMTLRIVVSSQNLLDLHDHVTLANAKVTK